MHERRLPLVRQTLELPISTIEAQEEQGSSLELGPSVRSRKIHVGGRRTRRRQQRGVGAGHGATHDGGCGIGERSEGDDRCGSVDVLGGVAADGQVRQRVGEGRGDEEGEDCRDSEDALGRSHLVTEAGNGGVVDEWPALGI